MSGYAILGLALGAVALAVTLFILFFADRRGVTDEPINDPVERQKWDEKARTVSDDFGLAAIRAASGKWAATAAAIVGILSTVAVVTGPADLAKDVGGTPAIVAAALILCAAGCAAIAVTLAGLAEQGTPVKGPATGQHLRALTKARATRASHQILWSRLLTVIALLLIVGATGIAWLAALTGNHAAAKQSAIVVDHSSAVCGTLPTSTAGAIRLIVDGTPRPIPGDAQVTLVDSCPK